jgi:hypothetical protein
MSVSLPRSLTRPMFQCALLLLVLGVGNVWIGYSKRAYYQSAVTKTAEDPLSKDSNREQITLQRLESRAEYYGLVQWGGVGFLCLAALLASADLLRRR